MNFEAVLAGLPVFLQKAFTNGEFPYKINWDKCIRATVFCAGMEDMDGNPEF